jgi:type VI secretion system protein ImpL
LRVLRDVSHEFPKPPVLQGEMLADLLTLDRFRQIILKVEKQNSRWWMPRFGLNESKNVEVTLKDKYCKQFNGGLLVSQDKQMADRMASFSDSTSATITFQHIDHLVKRINLLRATLEGQNLKTLEGMPQPSYEPIVFGTDQGLVPEIRQKFASLYHHYLIWRLDSSSLNQEMIDLQNWLKHVLTLKRTNLNWLAAWVNTNPSLDHLTLADFWGGGLAVAEETTVPPAFTVEGKKQINSFLDQIESALPDPLILAKPKLEFQQWYTDAYVTVWYNFGDHFLKGIQRLSGREEWQQMAAKMATDLNPYFSLLDRMTVELKPFNDREDTPEWMILVYNFKTIKREAATEKALKKKGALAKVTAKGKKLAKKLEKTAGPVLKSRLIATKAFRQYSDSLAQISQVSSSRRLAYQKASKAFDEDPATGQSPFFAAQNALATMKATLSNAKSGENMIWQLAAGPLDYLWAYVCQETACHLNTLWEKEVLVEVQGVFNKKVMNRLLFSDQEGYALKFIKGTASPFVSRNLQKGFYGKKVLGRNIPFRDSFFTFITKGVIAARSESVQEAIPVKDNYAVTIEGFPTDANKEAQQPPHATHLEVQCATRKLSLDNFNFPVSKTFNWSPQNCGDVILKIEVGSLTLARPYKGEQGFPKFLKDFSKGYRVFFPSEFPEHLADLKRMGIKYIKVKYHLTGHKPVLKLLKLAKPKEPKRIPRVPEAIVKCWDS